MDFKVDDNFEHTFAVNLVVYQGFLKTFNDNNPLHTEPEFAKDHGFKDSVMHGNILNGFISYFVGECLPQKDVIIHSQSIHFKKPVYLNDTLLFKATVTGVFESVNAVEFKFSFQNILSVVARGKIQIGILKWSF